MHPLMYPADPDALPHAVAVEPPDLRPIAPGGVERLRGGRLLTQQAMYVVVVAAGVLGAIASLSTGYNVHESGTGVLLEERTAGDAVSTIWSIAGAALGLLGLALAGRRDARWAAIGLLLLLAAMAAAVFVTFELDFNFDWDTYTVERWTTRALPAAIGVLAFAGPVLLVAQWILFRLERRARS
jgi:hypothetical protein